MTHLLASFSKNENGAITTEFLVLFAAVVGLGVYGFATLPEERVETNSDHNASIERFVAGF